MTRFFRRIVEGLVPHPLGENPLAVHVRDAAAVAELEFAVGGSTTWTDVVFTVRV